MPPWIGRPAVGKLIGCAIRVTVLFATVEQD
jgi:hypothetical protein